MAIAPLPDWEDLDALTDTRPALRLLSSPGESSRATDPGLRASPPARHGTARRNWSPVRRARLRRTALVALLLGLLGGLAVPVGALAGTSTPQLVAGEIYTVRPGDSLASIAGHLDPSRPGPLVAEMAAQTGAHSVVVGERIVLP